MIRSWTIVWLLLTTSCGIETAKPIEAPLPTKTIVPSDSIGPGFGQESITDDQALDTSLDKWELWVNGPHLRGVNIWQRIVIPDLDGDEFLGSGYVGPPYTQEDFNRLSDLGVNYVNISGPGLYTEEPPYHLDLQVQTHLDQLLDMIQQADLFAVITFRTGPGRNDFTFYRDGAGDWFDPQLLREWVWEDPEAQDAWVEMWRYTASRYRGHPIIVGYDLMCEPNPAGIREIWDPEEFYPHYQGTSLDWNQFYPRISQAIREVDPETPILIGGMGWSNVRWLPYLDPTNDERTVYLFHQYEPQNQYTHQDLLFPLNSYPGKFDLDWDGIPDTFDRDWLIHYLDPVNDFRKERDVIVAVNEYGIVRWVPGATEYLNDQMALFEGMGINYAIWMWDPAWIPWTDEVNAMNYRFGVDPKSRSDQMPNPLMDILQKYWGKNNIHPSDYYIK